MDLAVLHARLLKIDNGENADEVIRAVSKNFPEVNKSLPQEVVPPGRKRGSRGGFGSLEARRKIETGREHSLFDARENDAVAEPAARDRDLLEGESLTSPSMPRSCAKINSKD